MGGVVHGRNPNDNTTTNFSSPVLLQQQHEIECHYKDGRKTEKERAMGRARAKEFPHESASENAGFGGNRVDDKARVLSDSTKTTVIGGEGLSSGDKIANTTHWG